jgi:ribosomal protein L37AE/L43A
MSKQPVPQTPQDLKSLLTDVVRQVLQEIQRPSKPLCTVFTKIPGCPYCNGNEVVSSGFNWHCKKCGKYWVKKPLAKLVDPDMLGTKWGDIQKD